MRDAFVEQLEISAENDSELMFLTADLGFGVFQNFESRFPDQYLNVGIAEQLMAGVSAGLALSGKKVVMYSIGNFPTLRCLEQIRNDQAYHDTNVTIVASGGGFTYGQLGMSHHATEDLAIMRALPGVDVCAPGTLFETKELAKELFTRDRVGYLRLEKFAFSEDQDIPFEFGKLRPLLNGQDIAIIAIGGVVSEAMAAASELEKAGVSASVISCHTLKPFDATSLLEILSSVRGLVTVEEHSLIGGLASTIADVLITENLNLPIARLGLKDEYCGKVGDQAYLRKHNGIDSENIAKTALKLLREI